MDEHEKQALQILRDALDTAPDERDDFVSQRCGADALLRARIDSLLRGIAEADIAEAPDDPDEGLAVARRDQADALIGAQLGAFRVVERVGRGGMGVVYRGVREGADFAQEVALKLIRRGFDFDDVQARFLRERRILARLAHPNLARFIDGGVAPDGRPWFALEFVHGEAITHWCDAQRLDLRARVKLFLDVCAAVQYAHTRLVVHRDLKPRNVLVDETGAVRLLDFGVAGLLAGDAEDAAKPSTIGRHHALTPEYAAPEQFAGEGVGVSVDVYALGVTLYELIAGVLPHAIDRADLAAAERAVREQPPQPAAQAILRGSNAASPIAPAQRLVARRTTLRAYRAEVRGDLSRIVEKALAKEPARRYATVQAFADDLGRWLAGAPVRVVGNGVGYRFGKFVRRNRVAVGFAALALCAMLAGLVGVSLKNLEAQREAAKAKLSAERAREEARVAQGVSDFLGGVFGKAAPFNTSGKTLTLKEALEVARKEAMTAYKDQPETRIPILLAVGNAYEAMYLKPEARAALSEALDEAKALNPPKPALLSQAMSNFSEIELESDLDHSLALAEDAARLLRDAPDVDDGMKVHALAKLAGVLFHKRDFTRALDVTEERLMLFERSDTTSDDGYQETLSDKAMILAELGRHDEAIAMHRSLVDLRTRQAGREDDLNVSYERANLARALKVAGRNREAIDEMRKAIAVEKPVYGDNFRIASITTILAQALEQDGQLQEAEAQMIYAIRIIESDPELKRRAVGMRAVLATIQARAERCGPAAETLRTIKKDFPEPTLAEEERTRVAETEQKVADCVPPHTR